MADSAPEEAVRNLFDEVINGQQYDRVPAYCKQDVIMHRPGGTKTVGIDAYKNHYRGLHAVFPDFEATLTDILGDETRVATRFTVTGTHEGSLLGAEPTGNTITFSAQILFRFDEHAITEEFHQSDRTSLRAQLDS